MKPLVMVLGLLEFGGSEYVYRCWCDWVHHFSFLNSLSQICLRVLMLLGCLMLIFFGLNFWGAQEERECAGAIAVVQEWLLFNLLEFHGLLPSVAKERRRRK
jgi:hypothetical protein